LSRPKVEEGDKLARDAVGKGKIGEINAPLAYVTQRTSFVTRESGKASLPVGGDGGGARGPQEAIGAFLSFGPSTSDDRDAILDQREREVTAPTGAAHKTTINRWSR